MYIDNLACHIYIYISYWLQIFGPNNEGEGTCTFPTTDPGRQAFISVALTAVLSPGFKNSGFLSWKTSRLPGRTNKQTTNQPTNQTNKQTKTTRSAQIMTRLSWCHSDRGEIQSPLGAVLFQPVDAALLQIGKLRKLLTILCVFVYRYIGAVSIENKY